MPEIEEILKDRILVLDGAMGTMIQSFDLNESDFRGRLFTDSEIDLQGNNDVLSLTRPNVITTIHRNYLQAGSDIIETNTFNANAISQSDYGLADHVFDMNLAAAKLARSVVNDFTAMSPDKPRFVAGVLGPTNRTATLSPHVERPDYRNVDFDLLCAAYATQVEAMVEGNVDLLLIETVFDTLNCKAALFAIRDVLNQRGVNIPIMISGTITDASGRTLSGQTLEAFYNSIRHGNLLSVGLNCSLGAKELRPYIRELSAWGETFVSLHPNAGLPNELGEYDESPTNMAGLIKEFAESGMVNIVGGCCGTTPAHISAIVLAVSGLTPRKIPGKLLGTRLSGLEPLTILPDSLFVNVGERTNVAGSARFARLIREDKYEQALEIARQQIENGAQIIDINLDDAIFDSIAAMEKFLRLIASDPGISKVPVMIDSSDWNVIITGLRNIQGKGIVNSISLKDGEDEFLRKARQVKCYGAAVIVMAFDENGQAATYDQKVTICRRAYGLLTQKAGYDPEDIIFDPNIFAIATGMEEHQLFTIDYIKACKTLKKEFPASLISGGVSNVSFAFRGNNHVREAIHSVFLYQAIQAGMSMGIVNAGQLAIYDDLAPELKKCVEAVILNRSSDATDNLIKIAHDYQSIAKQKIEVNAWRTEPVEERIQHAVVEGLAEFIESDVAELHEKTGSALGIIEGNLMSAMQIVGDQFGAGKMFLPQVVKSARVMKKAVAYLIPFVELERKKSGTVQKFRGKIILATVKGDVHDIGKNIVNVVLGCNNYEIIDLGVMVAADKIIDEAQRHKVDIIGLSGLITPSLQEMTVVAGELERRGLSIPLMIGGATTSKIHTAVKIDPLYSGPVAHVIDASRSVDAVGRLLAEQTDYSKQLKSNYQNLRETYAQRKRVKPLVTLDAARKNGFKPDWVIYIPPAPVTLDRQLNTQFPLHKLTAFIDWTPFFHVWELKGKYPTIFNNSNYGNQARELYKSGQEWLKRIITDELLVARGVMQIFPANSRADDITIFSDDDRSQIAMVIHNLRQQTIGKKDNLFYSLSDFIAPESTGKQDWIGAFAVVVDYQNSGIMKSLRDQNDEYGIIMVKALADRLAEAYAEYLHWQVRLKFWGYAANENLDTADFISENYQGIRPAPGYPACPDHSQKVDLFKLLDAEKEIGVKLTENYAMLPTAAVSGWYFSHPDTRYFSVGKIDREQVMDYAGRKGESIEITEKLLEPNLAYERGT